VADDDNEQQTDRGKGDAGTVEQVMPRLMGLAIAVAIAVAIVVLVAALFALFHE
jgi:hypothetical protein